MKRSAGILLPVFSLPSPGGIGCFSKEAYEFVDFLKAAGVRCWQVLPMGPTGYGDSPYQSFSTFAGNPYFIDPETLVAEGLLTNKEASSGASFSASGRIDYALLYRERYQLLRLAFGRTEHWREKERKRFGAGNGEWLPDYALFMALKDAHGGQSFFTWEEGLKKRDKTALEEAKRQYAEEIAFYEFLQFEFEREFMALKSYAGEKGIRIIGDLPIYVALDSADVWASPELFALDQNGDPKAVAGCPPDYFAPTGQLWGNPLYDWKAHEKQGYSWWIRRIRHVFHIFDMVRIDHFRGFEAYYSIPFGEPTAEHGVWEKGPGIRLFKAVKKELGKLDIIAEDLGFLTKDVRKLLKKSGYPGMKVLQFAFGEEDSEYLTYHHPENSVAYTGTHDNPTTLAWAEELPKKERRRLCAYLGLPPEASSKELLRGLVRETLVSPAALAVIPLQDLLELGKEARINVPSTLGGNWEWRLSGGELTEELAKKLKKQLKLFGRFHKK